MSRDQCHCPTASGMEAGMDPEFQLRAELLGHAEDVRGLCVCDLGLVTVSRDKTAKIWQEVGDQAFECQTTLVGHKDYVSTAAYLPPGACSTLPQGALVTGSRDNCVILWDVAAAEPIRSLEGHKYQVTGVSIGTGGAIVSCSLDGSIREWQPGSGECSAVMEGHQGPVQCLLHMPGSGTLLSGSNDTTVKVWEDGQCVKTIKAHSDTVRGMALVHDIGLVTASHDMTAKVWTASGDCIAELVGHTALLYSATSSPDGTLLATASEDNTVRLWRLDGRCLQTLEHPACVWDVAFLPNGDLVTACADSVARVWSREPARVAPQEVRQAYTSALAARKEAAAAAGASSEQEAAAGGLPAGLTLEEPAALLVPGTKDGQTKVVREGGGAVAYGWSEASRQWEKIGDVVGGGNDPDTMTTGSKSYNGQTYDFVFDVEVEDGLPFKLALNRGDNPYIVADAFLERHNLPQTYREQIVQFIVQNTGGAVSMDVPMVNADPYTGGNAYVPTGAALNRGPPPPGGAAVDPFTGSGAYVPRAGQGAGNAAPTAGFSVTGGGADPFTGSSARPSAQGPSHIPYRSALVFDSLPKADSLRAKVLEFSDVVAAAPGGAELAVQQADAATLDSLLARAIAAGAAPALVEPESALLSRLMRWPAAQLFPVLDIARLLALSPRAAPQLGGMLGTWGTAGTCTGALAAAAAPPEVPATQLTALRLLTNLVAAPATRGWALANAGAAVDAYAGAAASGNKNVRQALAAALLNYAAQLASSGAGDDAEDAGMQLFSALFECLSAAPEDDAETQYRSIVGLGTLLSGSSKNAKVLAEVGHDLGLGAALQAAKAKTGKVAEAAAQALGLLGA